MIICAIHQPNFFPWTGYFDKIRKADIFIFLDEVTYPRGTWCNRVKLLNSKEPTWHGLPIQRPSSAQPIKDVRFSDKEFHLNKFKKSLQYNYSKTPFYLEAMQHIESLINFETNFLVEYNINAITKLSKLLNFPAQFIRQSDICHQQHSTDLLIELLKEVGADAYLCGSGASGYQDDGMFTKNQLKLIYQNYSQQNDTMFKNAHENEQGLSVLHSLFNTGFPP